MVKFLISAVLLCSVWGMAQEGPAVEEKVDWVVWIDGVRYAAEWSDALQTVWTVMKPGQRGLLQTRSAAHAFVRTEAQAQLEELVETVRGELEREAQALDQLGEELGRHANGIAAMMDQGSIRNFINVREQLLERYAAPHKRFWSTLEKEGIPSGARLVVLVQQFDIAAVGRQTLSAMMEGNLRDWVLELQDSAPWEEKGKTVKQIAAKLKEGQIRVDGFYIKNRTRSVRGGTEVSKAFFSGVTRLCKSSGGSSQNLKGKVEENVALLSR